MKQADKKKKNTLTRDLGGGLKGVKPSEPELRSEREGAGKMPVRVRKKK